MRKIFLICCVMLCASGLSAAKKYKLVEIETNLGLIKVKLYQNTPLHSENFLKLAKEKHYEGVLFHRVIKDFMIQGGASDSQNAEKGKLVGESDPGYTIDAEFRPENRHFKGALAAARQGDAVNPDKKSSGEQFYIVQGKPHTDQELDRMMQGKLYMAKNALGEKLYAPLQEEHRRLMMSGKRAQADSLIQSINQKIEKQFANDSSFVLSPETREMYKSVGGTPHLDGDYTVFGEVVEGMDVIDKIAAVKTNPNNRPEEDVVILRMKLKRK